MMAERSVWQGHAVPSSKNLRQGTHRLINDVAEVDCRSPFCGAIFADIVRTSSRCAVVPRNGAVT